MEMRKGVLIVLEDGRERFLKYTLNSLRILEKDYGVKLDKLDKDFSLEMVDLGHINMVTTKLTEALGGLQKPKA